MEKSQKIGHRKQAFNIQRWKPWLKAGVKTEEGKAVTSQNAWKHGYRSVEGVQFLKSFYARGKIAREATDWVLSSTLLMDLIDEADTYKPSVEANKGILRKLKNP